MASPYTITRVESIAAAKTANIIAGQTGRTLVAPSRVIIALNRQVVEILFDIFIGSERVMVQGSAAINTVAGDIPILPDNVYIDTFGNAGDEIILNATNTNAAAKEARAVIIVTEVDDVALQQCMDQLATRGII